ncbi:BTB/POZ domain-containing protein [Ditylenchus destructor]|nr:BTB/POZ domain-containing protein [Ditylenchus destructor]
MSGNNSAPNDDWVRLNVGGKMFQTTKDTLSRYPDTFLARMVNGGLSSAKDESGAYLIDADPEHFRTILNYLRRGSIKLDSSKMNLEDLLREADFFNIEPLVIEIHDAMSCSTRENGQRDVFTLRQALKDHTRRLPNLRPFERAGAPEQMTAMTNQILAKMDDMSNKLKPRPIMPYNGRYTPDPTTAMTNRILAKIDDMSKKLSPAGTMPMMSGPMMPSTGLMGHPSVANSCTMSQQPNFPRIQGPMVCRNCNKVVSCCNNAQPEMPKMG